MLIVNIVCVYSLLFVLYCEATIHASVKYRVSSNGIKVSDVVHSAWKCGDTQYVNVTCTTLNPDPRVWQHDDTTPLQGRVALVKGSQLLVMRPPQTLASTYTTRLPFVLKNGFGMTIHMLSVKGKLTVDLLSTGSAGSVYHLHIRFVKAKPEFKLNYKVNNKWSGAATIIAQYPFSSSGPSNISVIVQGRVFKVDANNKLSANLTSGTDIEQATHLDIIPWDSLELAGIDYHV